MILLIYFLIFFVLMLMMKRKTIVLFFIGIQILSLIGGLIVGFSYEIDTIFKAFNLAFTIFALTMIILPWVSVSSIKFIEVANPDKIKKLTRFLLVISILPFVIFSVVSFFVITMVEDIDNFKYTEDVATDFVYSLPINIKLLILANYSYYFAYFLIPLHFYYLAKGKYGLSILCFIFSLNIVLYGVTFFSRSVYIHYILIYISSLLLLYNVFSKRVKNTLKIVAVVIMVAFSSYFIYISNQRFTAESWYANQIPATSNIQDPTLYSYFDYLSQWYSNSSTLLNEYNFSTFGGQITFQPLLSILGQYGIISYNNADYVKLRTTLWPEHWYTFNGYVSYSVYDYGYVFTILFSVMYFLAVLRVRPMLHVITINKLFAIVLLIQIPLTAIFYSGVSATVIPFICLIPIYLYLKISIKPINKDAKEPT